MAAENAVPDETPPLTLEDETTCIICLESYMDPVIIHCGHSFCRTCITEYWKGSDCNVCCPICRVSSPQKNLIPNRQLATIVQNYTEHDLQSRSPQSKKRCIEPKTDLSVSSESDPSLISTAGERSTAHPDQLLDNLKYYKENLKKSLGILKEEKDSLLVYQATNEKECKAILTQIEAEREKTTASFLKHHQFLAEEEHLLIGQLDNLQNIVKQKSENLTKVTEKICSLDNFIQELELKEEQSENDFLKDIENVLKRCPKENQTFTNIKKESFVEQNRTIQDLIIFNPFLDSLLEKMKASLKNGLQLTKVLITFDNKTANTKLRFSDDLKRVTWGRLHMNLPEEAARFKFWPIVLGEQRISSGLNFWDVGVEECGTWSVGVVRHDMVRKIRVELCSEESVWHFGFWRNHYRRCDTYKPLLPAEKPKKVRVTLSMLPSGNQIIFSNADSGALLTMYSGFAGKIFLPFFFVSGNSSLTICP